MANKCPLCESPCIVKIVATGNAKYAEIDVCSVCGATVTKASNPKTKANAGKKSNKTRKTGTASKRR